MGRVLLSGGFTNYTWTNIMKLSDATGIFLGDLGERRNIPEATGKLDGVGPVDNRPSID